MTEYDFDAIVVGSGCAGAVAAYELATAGKSVLVVERGESAGSKNMTGGRIYTHSLAKVFPDFKEDAPLERKIVQERISLMSEDANFTMNFTSEMMREEGRESYSVLRAPFDQWLSSKAEDAGAEYIYGIPVDDIVKDEAGKVIGIKAGEDEITAAVTILCDGVNSLLTEKAVGYKKPPASQIAVGVKETYALPASVITDRICVASDDEGAAWMIAGDATKGKFGGGFMYTNKESISLGIVAGIAAVETSEYPIYQMMEDLKNHPAIAPLIRDAELVEYSGHMVPEGGINIMPQLVGDGVMVAGESAMMCINFGYVVRGMDYAIAAGQMAGKAAAAAIDSGNTSAQGLQPYVTALENSFVLKDMKSFANAPAFMEGFDRMFYGYPQMVRDIMNDMFVIDGSPAKHVKEMAMPRLKEIGYGKLFKDVRGAMKAL